ncbi:radical SAM protein [Candidatus Woesearchaeota archaeon]|nr:radical SAM protein [Candidatus Woesearchaeota archaeon]
MKIKKTVIFMGYTCNNKCIFCCNGNKRNTIKDKSTNEIKQDLIKSKNQGTGYIELIGGEPTIRKDIFEIVSFAKNLGFKTIMFATNGRMLSNKEFAKKIIDKGVNHLVFSIHGNSSELHDKLTQTPGSFKQLIKGIKNLQELGFKNIGTNTTIVKQNHKNLLNIGKLIYKLGINNSEFIFIDPTNIAPKKEFSKLVPSCKEISPYVNKLLEFGKNKKISHWHIRYYPLCFVKPEYHSMISELHEIKTFHTEIIAPDFINKNVAKSRKNIARSKIKECIGCKYDNICEGYWSEYLKCMK